jgi:hypothetical protein
MNESLCIGCEKNLKCEGKGTFLLFKYSDICPFTQYIKGTPLILTEKQLEGILDRSTWIRAGQTTEEIQDIQNLVKALEFMIHESRQVQESSRYVRIAVPKKKRGLRGILRRK